METFIHNVKDIDADTLRSLEHVVGQHLAANQQVMIRVTAAFAEPDEQAKSAALARAAEIARQGRTNAANASEREANDAIEEALREVRQQQRRG